MAGLLFRSLPSATLNSFRLLSSFSSPNPSLLRQRDFFFPRAFSSSSAASAAPVDSSSESRSSSHIRNVAVIAHVDHGKTTLMDRLLRQCGTDVPHERFMDSISLERERGITIASKVNTILWKDYELNMVDTPGHADFGGEVERVVGMVEGAILVVDSGEGPLAQTRFVLAKALKYGLRPVLLLNKVDRPSVSEEMCNDVESKVFDLFANLGATEEQLEFPVLYASAKQGWASLSFTKDPPDEVRNMSQLLDAVIKHVPPPTANIEEPFQMLVSMLEKDTYMGRILTGRVTSGSINIGDRIHGLQETSSGSVQGEVGKVSKIMKKKGTCTVQLDHAAAGDIISVAGLSSPSIGHTVAGLKVLEALPGVRLDPPTISMTFGVNDSPLAGRDGTNLTGTKIGNRLMAETETNLAINVRSTSDSFEVQGRGELQLGILIENMRREGFELSVSPPEVMYKTENGEKLEPVEEVMIEVNEEHVGLVMEALTFRKGEIIEMSPIQNKDGTSGRTRLSFTCPSRGLMGYKGVFNNVTRGTGFMHSAFLAYEKHRGPLGHVRKGVLVSMARGITTMYALLGLEPRGILFVSPGIETYDGMIVGENSKDEDLDVNPTKGKELTNMRAATKEDTVRLIPPKLITLEEAIGYVRGDELIEITPKAIRLRKKILDCNKRKQMRHRTKHTG